MNDVAALGPAERQQLLALARASIAASLAGEEMADDAPADKRRRAIELLEQVGMGDRLDHHSSQLSGGQQQRVAIARALVNDPSILLADEPTGNLDSRTSRDVIRLFRQLNEQSGITIIIVTHEQEVARHARRWVVLRDGRIVQRGVIRDFLETPRDDFVSQFVKAQWANLPVPDSDRG